MKDTAEVLRSQVCTADLNDIGTNAISGNIFSHPMNSLMGTEMCAAAERGIKNIEDLKIVWTSVERYGESSIVRAIQLFSHKISNGASCRGTFVLSASYCIA